MKIGVLLISFCLPFCLRGQMEQTTLIKEQQQIIAVFSGEKPTEEGKWIKSRSNKAERAQARSYLIYMLENIGLAPDLFPYTMPNIHPVIDLLFGPFRGANVVTTIEATEPTNEYIVLGAHFDTERNCPGAIDNGTGVALVYEVGKYLIQLPKRNKHVILIFFDQEEEELNGSRAFAQHLRNKNYNIHSVHTVDAIGWDQDGDRAVELELPTAELETIYRSVGATLNTPLHTTAANSTDHHSFRSLEFNTIGLTCEYVNGDYTPYKDTPQDTYDTVNFDYLANATLLVFEVVKSLLEQP